MNVLSLFDGMSCGQIALNRANIPYNNYFASEIDKYAIQITQKNYPKTIQLGDIKNWREWNLPRIDIILAGSPCQGFSRAGKGLNFDDPRSKLFFVFVEILKFCQSKNPALSFLLENVRMKKEWQDVISEQVGVQPILIDSALVSAQSRKRLYWTDIPNVQLPEDKGILLKDIIEDGITDRDKSFCIDANYYKGGSLDNYLKKKRRQGVLHQSKKRLMVQQIDSLYENNAQAGRVYSIEGKSTTLKGEAGGLGAKTGLYEIGDSWRKLTPLECERLQTVPEGYTEGVSNTQRYRMLGNGWTVDIIVHILRNL